jgi:uncharacterized protein YceK
MKKTFVASCLMIPVLLLGGCASVGGKQTESKADQPQESGKTQAKENASSGNNAGNNDNRSSDKSTGSNANTKETSNHNSDKASTTSTNNTSSEKEYASLDKLKKDIKANLKTNVQFVMPTNIPKDKNTYYSAAIDNKSAGYSVIIFQTKEPVQINDASLNNLGDDSKLVTLTGTKYETAEAAKDKVGYQKVQQENTDLGYGIKGLIDGAVGSKYLTWNEGRWYLGMRAHTDDPVDLETNAKNMVNS